MDYDSLTPVEAADLLDARLARYRADHALAFLCDLGVVRWN